MPYVALQHLDNGQPTTKPLIWELKQTVANGAHIKTHIKAMDRHEGRGLEIKMFNHAVGSYESLRDEQPLQWGSDGLLRIGLQRTRTGPLASCNTQPPITMPPLPQMQPQQMPQQMAALANGKRAAELAWHPNGMDAGDAKRGRASPPQPSPPALQSLTWDEHQRQRKLLQQQRQQRLQQNKQQQPQQKGSQRAAGKRSSPVPPAAAPPAAAAPAPQTSQQQQGAVAPAAADPSPPASPPRLARIPSFFQDGSDVLDWPLQTLRTPPTGYALSSHYIDDDDADRVAVSELARLCEMI